MSISRPYKRTCRQFVGGSYAEGGRARYIVDPRYAEAPGHYVRAFLLIQKDLQELFDFIEPADENLGCYSYRVHALLLRTCVEVEANCVAILKENGYPKPEKNMTMDDYKRINKTHRLSSYQIKVPHWSGSKYIRTPFEAWGKTPQASLPWYVAYNTTKHDRQKTFKQANFDHLLDACCGLLALLSAQFYDNDFGPGSTFLATQGNGDGMESGIGEYFRVKFPKDWPSDMLYDFDFKMWQILKTESDPFLKYDYTK